MTIINILSSCKKSLTGGVALSVLWCLGVLLYAGAAQADVCFLPSGKCGFMKFTAQPAATQDDTCTSPLVKSGGCDEGYNQVATTTKTQKGSTCYRCDKETCSASEYKYSYDEAQTKINNGYDCSLCKDEDSKQQSKYKCRCSKTEYDNLCTDCNTYNGGYTATKTNSNVCMDPCPIGSGIISKWKFCCSGLHETVRKSITKTGSGSYSCVCDTGYGRTSNGVCDTTCHINNKYDTNTECLSGIPSSMKCVKNSGCWERTTKSDVCTSGVKASACNTTTHKLGSQIDQTELGTPCYECAEKSDVCTNGVKASDCDISTHVLGSQISQTELGTPCYRCLEDDKDCNYTYTHIYWFDNGEGAGFVNCAVYDTDTTKFSANDTCKKNDSKFASTSFWNSYPSVYAYNYESSSVDSQVYVYNKIDSTSKTCKKIGKTYYEKVCAGTPKSACRYGKFTSNGCKSADSYDAYSQNGASIVGNEEYGKCEEYSCPEGYYNSREDCTDANKGKVCARKGDSPCYATCETYGYFSSAAACGGAMCDIVPATYWQCYDRTKAAFEWTKFDNLNKVTIQEYKGGDNGTIYEPSSAQTIYVPAKSYVVTWYTNGEMSIGDISIYGGVDGPYPHNICSKSCDKEFLGQFGVVLGKNDKCSIWSNNSTYKKFSCTYGFEPGKTHHVVR